MLVPQQLQQTTFLPPDAKSASGGSGFVPFRPPQPVTSKHWLARQKNQVAAQKPVVVAASDAAADEFQESGTGAGLSDAIKTPRGSGGDSTAGDSITAREEAKDLLGRSEGVEQDPPADGERVVVVDGESYDLDDNDAIKALPIEKKEQIARLTDTFRFLPQLNVKTEHARFVVTQAAQNPNSLVGWQVMLRSKSYK